MFTFELVRRSAQKDAYLASQNGLQLERFLHDLNDPEVDEIRWSWFIFSCQIACGQS